MKPKNDALETSVSNTFNINAEIILNRAPFGLRLKTPIGDLRKEQFLLYFGRVNAS